MPSYYRPRYRRRAVARKRPPYYFSKYSGYGRYKRKASDGEDESPRSNKLRRLVAGAGLAASGLSSGAKLVGAVAPPAKYAYKRFAASLAAPRYRFKQSLGNPVLWGR